MERSAIILRYEMNHQLLTKWLGPLAFFNLQLGKKQVIVNVTRFEVIFDAISFIKA